MTSEVALLEQLGFSEPRTIQDVRDRGQVMAKADDNVVSIAQHDGDWISIWGQYDFNILPDVSAEPLVRKLPEAGVLIYVAIEGTSGSLVYERFERGVLTASYAEVEGEVQDSRCRGIPPPRDEAFGQVDEWGLLNFALPAELPYEEISEARYTHYRFDPVLLADPSSGIETKAGKSWWRFW